MQSAILTLCIGAFHRTADHVCIPSTEAGGEFKAQLEAFEESLRYICITHLPQWKNEARKTDSLGNNLLAKTKAGAAFAKSSALRVTTAGVGGAAGAAVGTAGLVRIAALPLVWALDRIGSSGSTGKASEFARHVFMSPARNARNGFKNGWKLFSPSQLASEVYESIYRTGEERKTHASTLERLALKFQEHQPA